MKLRIFNMVEITINRIKNHKYDEIKLDKHTKKTYKNNVKKKLDIEEEIAMFSAMDIAIYIINYATRNGYRITNLYLQKILYYVQAYALCIDENHIPLFRENIIAWQFGPVVPSVYRYFSGFGSSPIDNNLIDIEVNEILDEHIQQWINEIIDVKIKKTPWDLVDETHEEAPWVIATNNGSTFNAIIDNESIIDYFNTNIDRIIS